MYRPLIGITPGDPSGIGPEIALKALREKVLYKKCRPLVIAGQDVLAATQRMLDDDRRLVPYSFDRANEFNAGRIIYYDSGARLSSKLVPGEISAENGQWAYRQIETGVQLARDGLIDALCTGPIHKIAMKLAGITVPGHTEIFGGLCGIAEPLTMFEVYRLRIFFLTRHLSLVDACRQVTRERLVNFIPLIFDGLRQLGLPMGPVAIAALNPHAGDGGRFGTEELTEIIPAIEWAREKGWDMVGPVPADSVFHLAAEGRYMAVLSLYHDQGHIAAKSLAFDETVALTLGLPFLRVSVDHGTAMDIAGKGQANAQSMIRAIESAAFYTKNGDTLHPID